jgi:hypothetical protein
MISKQFGDANNKGYPPRKNEKEGFTAAVLMKTPAW